MNRIDPNDPRLTAYALGEMDEAERAEFEKLLEESEEDLSLIAEYRNLAEVLSQELASEPHPVLTPEQRGVIVQRLANSNGKPTSGFTGWPWFFRPYQLAGALATCLVLGLGLLFLQSNAPAPRNQAKVETLRRMEVAKGASTTVEEIQGISNLQSEPPQAATERFARGLEVKPEPTLTVGLAGRPLVETGDRVAAVPATAPVPPSVPQPEAARVVVARGDRAREEGQFGVALSKELNESEHPTVENVSAPFKLEAAATEGTTIVDFKKKDVDWDSAGLQESKEASPKDKVASIAANSRLSAPSPGGKEPSRESRRSQSRLAGAINERIESLAITLEQPQTEVSTGTGKQEADWFYSSPATNTPSVPASSIQGGALVQQPAQTGEGRLNLNAQIPSEVAGSGGMAGMGMMGMGMIMGPGGPAVPWQVAAGTEGGTPYYNPYIERGRLVAVGEKPEVITPTESEGVETYSGVVDNPFKSAADEPLSTFSIDVDTASYSNLRRYLNQGSLPPKEAVRIEEMLNYFPYDYAPPTGEEPFATHAEVAECPWNSPHRLVRIGIKGKVPPGGDRPACNLVFLIDVSGSMQPENKLPLLKKAMTLLLNQLQPSDQVAIVTYAGSTSLVLPSTPCSNKPAIQAAIDNLRSGGSTNGEGGIQLAYKTAEQTFLKSGINRVILATDGDFNVGVTSREELEKIITDKAKGGVFLSVLGFGMGNLKDATLETLADKGNGNYAYIDTLQEARKVLVEQMSGTLMTIAKDVKIQVEFNPGRVGAYRLIGYENRVMAAQDFNDDRKDAGEIGAGHAVTALYEVVPVGTPINMAGVDPLKYQKPAAQPAMTNVDSPEMMTVKLRYKAPDGDTSKLIEVPVIDPGPRLDGVTPDFKFAAAVASFGMLLRESPYRGTATFDSVLALAKEGKGADMEGYRTEFIQLVGLAKALSP